MVGGAPERVLICYTYHCLYEGASKKASYFLQNRHRRYQMGRPDTTEFPCPPRVVNAYPSRGVVFPGDYDGNAHSYFHYRFGVVRRDGQYRD